MTGITIPRLGGSRKRFVDDPTWEGRPPVAVRSRVLLVGAEVAQGEMIRRALVSDGYDVNTRGSGRDAVLTLAAGEPAEVLLVNAPLPDGSAAALLRWTRSRPTSALMACMVIAPRGDAQLAAGLYDAGADFVILGPTQLDLLSRKVKAALARRNHILAMHHG